MSIAPRRYLLGFLNIHPGEGRLVALSLLYAFLLAIAESLAYTAGYALFLTKFDAQSLPYTYIGASVCAMLLSFAYLKLSERVALSTMILGMLGFLWIAFLGYRLGLATVEAGWLVFSLPIYLGVAQILSYITFWNLLGRLFNLQQGKRLFGLLGAGRGTAAVITGVFTPLLVNWFNTANLFWIVLAALAAAIGVFVYLSHTYADQLWLPPAKTTTKPSERAATSDSGFPINRYIVFMMALYVLWVFTEYFIDNLFYTQISVQYPTENQLAGFIGLFTGVVGALGLLIQLFVASRILNRFRLSTILLVTPVLLTACSLVFVLTGTFFPSSAILVGVPVLSSLLLNVMDSIDAPAMNVLYQPLSAQHRTRVQTVIDGILNPLSIGVGGALLLLLTNVWQWGAVPVTVVLLVILLGWITAAVLVGRAYPAQLRQAVANRTLQQGALTRLDTASVAILQESLANPHGGVVLYVLDLLATVAPASLPTVLPTLLEHRERAVRLEALRRTEELGLSQMAPAIWARFPAEGSAAVQSASLRTLAVLGDAQRLDEIIPYLEHSERSLQLGAMVGLLRSGELAGILAAGAKLNELVRSPRPADREFVADALGEGGVAGFYRPLLQLLADEQPQVQRAALLAAAKLKHPKLWPAATQLLATPAVRAAAQAALIAGGVAVLPELAQFATQRASEGQDQARAILSAVARICGRIGGEEASLLLYSQLTYPNAAVRGEVVTALNRCGYRADAADRPLIHQQIKAEATHAAWTLATWRDLDGASPERIPVERVKEALLGDLLQQRVRLFGWLSLLYEPALIAQVQTILRHEGDADQKGYALEILHLALPPELKAILLPLLVNANVIEALQRLNPLFPQPTLTTQERLGAILSGSDEWISPWAKVCALYAIGQSALMELAEPAQAALNSGEPTVRQAAHWALARLDAGQNGARSGAALATLPKAEERGKLSMLMLVEKVIGLKAVDFLAESGEEVLADLAALLEEKTAQAGDLLQAKGERDAAMYLIVAGQVRLHDGERTVTLLGEQETWGELALFNPIPQLLAASAVTDVHLLRLPQAALRQVLEEQNDMAWQIMGRLAQRVQRTQGIGRAEQAKADLLGGLREKLTRVQG